MSEKTIYILNVSVSLISPVRLAGEDQMKEILGVENIPSTTRALLAQEVIDRKVLNPLAAIKKQVRDLLLRYGSRDPLLGWAVSPERMDNLMEEIKKKEKDFHAAKTAMLDTYQNSCLQHVAKLHEACQKEGMDPEHIAAFLQVVQGAQPDSSYLDRQIQFRYLEPRAIDLREGEVEVVVEGLFGQALKDVASRSKEALRALRNTTKVNALLEILRKLRGLAYLDGRFAYISGQIEALLEAILNASPPNESNKEFDIRSKWALTGALELLSDEQRVLHRLALEQKQSLFELPTAVEPEVPVPQPTQAPEAAAGETAAPPETTPITPLFPAVDSSQDIDEGQKPSNDQTVPETTDPAVTIVANTLAW